MKKSIVAIIIYFLTIHIALPGIYYLIYGFAPVYTDLIDLPALIKSFYLIVCPILLALLLILIIPSKDDVIEPSIDGKPVSELFYFSIFLKLFIFYYYGGFSAVIAGEANGTLGNYLSLFFNPFVLLLVLLFAQKKRSNAILAVLFYILSTTLSGSRSGILSIVFVFLIGYSFVTFKLYKKSLYRFVAGGLLVAPMIFIFATNLRGYTDSISMSLVFDQIAGRMSVLETSMLPIHFLDNGLNMDLFYEKYSFINQFKLSLDSIIPGQLFDFDVMPNNYYRAIFMGYDQSFVMDNYMSINLTLPIYLFLKYSYLSIILTPLYILSFYKIAIFFKKYPLIVILVLSVFYYLLYFFDWVFIFTQLYKSVLTLIFLKIYMLCRNEFKLSILRSKYAN